MSHRQEAVRLRIQQIAGNAVAADTVGQLRVKGPTGCRYPADERQQIYVKDGWNYAGDAYLMDVDGCFHYQARTDDMIISAGYNIAAPDVEEALMLYPVVSKCAVVGVADEERGRIVKGFVVLRRGEAGGPEMFQAPQDFVKQAIAPYKYPCAIEFIDKLPRTQAVQAAAVQVAAS